MDGSKSTEQNFGGSRVVKITTLIKGIFLFKFETF